MLLRLLEALEKNVNGHECAVNDILCDYDEEICHKCERDCNECKDDLIERIKKLKEEVVNKQTVSTDFSSKLLDSMIEATEIDGCGVFNTLNHFDGLKEIDCTGNCVACKKECVERIEKLKKQAISEETSDIQPVDKVVDKTVEEASEQTVEYINLDALDSLKYKLKEKYDVLFNKFEVTEFERGELDAFTQTLYMIDDIMEKQAISDKTSETSSETRKELDNVNRPKHQNMTIRNLVEVGYFKFNVKLDDSYYEFECLPTDFIDFVYGEDFLNQEIIAITQGTDGKMYVTLKEKQND